MANLRTPEVERLLEVLAGVRDTDTMYALLEDVFTIREIRESSQRLAVAQMLDAGRSYAKIEEATGASATTIARVSKCLSYGAGGYRSALELLKELDVGGEGASRGEDGALGKGASRGEDGAPGDDVKRAVDRANEPDMANGEHA